MSGKSPTIGIIIKGYGIIKNCQAGSFRKGKFKFVILIGGRSPIGKKTAKKEYRKEKSLLIHHYKWFKGFYEKNRLSGLPYTLLGVK